MQQRIYRLVFWVGYLSVLIVTFLPLGLPNELKIGSIVFYFRLDLLLHFFVYFLICMYFLFGLIQGLKLFGKNSLRKYILLILLLGIVTEFVQLWVPERYFNVVDLISNVSGIITGLVVIRIVQRRKGLSV